MTKTVYFTSGKVMFRNSGLSVWSPLWGAEGKSFFPAIPASSFSFLEQAYITLTYIFLSSLFLLSLVQRNNHWVDKSF